MRMSDTPGASQTKLTGDRVSSGAPKRFEKQPASVGNSAMADAFAKLKIK